MMHLKKHFKEVVLILVGAVIFWSVENLILNSHGTEEVSSLQKIASVENRVRKTVADFKDEGLKIKIYRKPDCLVLRIWEDNLFQINHWSINSKNKEFFSNLALAMSDRDSENKIKILSHYDSINPYLDGANSNNKIKITQNRVKEIENIFLKEGHKQENLLTLGLGDLKPLVDDRDPFGGFIADNGYINRRVELVLYLGESKDVL